MSIIFLLNFAFASDSTSTSCIPSVHMIKIADSYPQFKRFLKGSSADSYCKVDLGTYWFEIAEALSLVLDMDEVSQKRSSVFDHATQGWVRAESYWKYLTSGTDRFDITPARCEEGTAAYFWSHILGEINICVDFLFVSRTYRASVLLHERRHFDDADKFYHVPCKEHTSMCDSSITMAGAYAMTTQALVKLSLLKSSRLSSIEQRLSAAEALLVIDKKFVDPPKVEMESGLYLATQSGEILSWAPRRNQFYIVAKPNFLGDQFLLSAVQDLPLHTLDFINDLVVYPLAGGLPPYRISYENSPSKILGNIAEYFAIWPVEKQRELIAASYSGSLSEPIVLATQSSLVTACVYNDMWNWFPALLAPVDLIGRGEIRGEGKDGKISPFILSSSGQSVSVSCPKNLDGTPRVKIGEIITPTDIKKIVPYLGAHIGLRLDGRIVNLIRVGSEMRTEGFADLGALNLFTYQDLDWWKRPVFVQDSMMVQE